jgi:hypothetical protein
MNVVEYHTPRGDNSHETSMEATHLGKICYCCWRWIILPKDPYYTTMACCLLENTRPVLRRYGVQEEQGRHQWPTWYSAK